MEIQIWIEYIELNILLSEISEENLRKVIRRRVIAIYILRLVSP